MSLILNQGTKPEGLEIKTWGMEGFPDVQLGEYEISMADFMEAALYVLTNTDLEDTDPRMDFLRRIKSIETGPGYMSGRRRLVTP